ncbi:MAG: hypothetical protein M1820_002271 [Bogoriella megaspora]|nr:MAG: hypothetical protein M1820_002271 [Bogoriella megaspora]
MEASLVELEQRVSVHSQSPEPPSRSFQETIRTRQGNFRSAELSPLPNSEADLENRPIYQVRMPHDNQTEKKDDFQARLRVEMPQAPDFKAFEHPALSLAKSRSSSREPRNILHVKARAFAAMASMIYAVKNWWRVATSQLKETSQKYFETRQDSKLHCDHCKPQLNVNDFRLSSPSPMAANQSNFGTYPMELWLSLICFGGGRTVHDLSKLQSWPSSRSTPTYATLILGLLLTWIVCAFIDDHPGPLPFVYLQGEQACASKSAPSCGDTRGKARGGLSRWPLTPLVSTSKKKKLAENDPNRDKTSQFLPIGRLTNVMFPVSTWLTFFQSRRASEHTVSDQTLKEDGNHGACHNEGPKIRHVEFQWRCVCGETFVEWLEEAIPGALQEMASDLSTSESSDIGLSDLSSSRSSSSETTAPSSASGPAHSRNGYSSPLDDLTIDIDGPIAAPTLQCSLSRKFILCCVSSNGQERLKHVDVTHAKTDRCMYRQLHRLYFTPLRKLMMVLTLRKLDCIQFTRFELFNKENVAIEPCDIGSLPPEYERGYEYNRKHPHRPLIPQTVLKHWTENPEHVRSTKHIRLVPTKISGMLEWPEDEGGEVEGWGLRFREQICWKKVWIAEGIWATAAIIFAIIWCIYHDGDLQDGFTVAGVVLAYGTIFLGLLQGFAQYLDKSL